LRPHGNWRSRNCHRRPFAFRNLECVQESAERAANLTRHCCAFARRQVIEPRRINLNELIVNLNKMAASLIGGGH